jgi:thiamine-monophosphate kinase
MGGWQPVPCDRLGAVLTESLVIARIRASFLGGEALGDDCGAIPGPPPGSRLLVTMDALEEGQHFRRDWHPPRLLGRKLLRVNLSDLDASGASPVGFTLSLALGRDLDPDWVWALLEGLAEAARDLGIPVLGGDTVGRPAGLGLVLTAFGHAQRWLHRGGLRAGDTLFVDQPLGASLRGLRKLQAGLRWDPALPDPDLSAHLDPRPNLGLGVALSRIPEVSACIDLSDGLSRDLGMLAEASGLSVALAPDLPPDWVRGGEDYARCFASSLPQPELEAILGRPLFPVATAVPRGAAPLLAYDGRAVRDQSFDHFAPPTQDHHAP